MVTALTVYPVENAASTTLSTADPLVAVTGGVLAGANTCNTSNSTGYGELYSQGFATAWPSAGSIGSPSGHGWFFDGTTLDGQQIIAGNWTPTISLKVSAGSSTADIYMRAYIYSSGTYTQIGSNMVLTAQTLTGLTGTYSFAATSLPVANFTTGKRLYLDCWLNITAGGTSGANIAFRQSSTAQGNTGCQIVTPGYQPIPSSGNFFALRQHHAVGRLQ